MKLLKVEDTICPNSESNTICTRYLRLLIICIETASSIGISSLRIFSSRMIMLNLLISVHVEESIHNRHLQNTFQLVGTGHLNVYLLMVTIITRWTTGALVVSTLKCLHSFLCSPVTMSLIKFTKFITFLAHLDLNFLLNFKS